MLACLRLLVLSDVPPSYCCYAIRPIWVQDVSFLPYRCIKAVIILSYHRECLSFLYTLLKYYDKGMMPLHQDLCGNRKNTSCILKLINVTSNKSAIN